MSLGRTALAVLVASTLVGVACGGDDDDSGEAEPTDATTTETSESDGGEPLTDSFRGVTAESIKLGFVMVDYECIADFIDFRRGDDQAAYQAFIDEINDNGGILGRTIDPVYESYCPIGNAEALQLCTSFTEDDEVFAVLGVFIDFSGDAQLCLSRDNETIHIGAELNQAWIDQAPPGLLLTPGITSERRIDVLLSLIQEEGILDGLKVAVLADDENGPRAEDKIVPALEDLGLELGSTAVLTVTGTETTAPQAQLDGFIARWKEEGVEAVMITGLSLTSRQWVEKIGREMPGTLFLVDAPSAAIEAAIATEAAGVDPNPYENMYTAIGETDEEIWELEPVQRCAQIYEEATGETVVPPAEVTPGPDGKRVLTHASVEVNCTELEMFKDLAEAAGPDLTNDTWAAVVNDYGPIEVVNTSFASLHEGKYDAHDAFRLGRFDGSLGDGGDWAPLGEIIDTTG